MAALSATAMGADRLTAPLVGTDDFFVLFSGACFIGTWRITRNSIVVSAPSATSISRMS